MTREDKDLLLKDLCSRLPYGVKVNYNDNVCTIQSISPDGDILLEDEGGIVFPDIVDSLFVNIEYVKPYLFPLSSMAVEQICKVQNLLPSNCNISFKNQEIIFYDEDNVKLEQLDKLFNLFNMWHIDYRNLITKGLAIDATRLNIY